MKKNHYRTAHIRLVRTGSFSKRDKLPPRPCLFWEIRIQCLHHHTAYVLDVPWTDRGHSTTTGPAMVSLCNLFLHRVASDRDNWNIDNWAGRICHRYQVTSRKDTAKTTRNYRTPWPPVNSRKRPDGIVNVVICLTVLAAHWCMKWLRPLQKERQIVTEKPNNLQDPFRLSINTRRCSGTMPGNTPSHAKTPDKT